MRSAPGLALRDQQPWMTFMKTVSLRLALSTATAALVVGVAPSWANVMLPAPYVSRALDAVLLPIDEAVRATFDLADDDTGVLVLATEPDGVADANDIVPGDVLHMVAGQRISSPIEVDEIVYYWILEGIVDFDLGTYRDGGYVEVISTISEDSYWEVIEITTIETWSSWEVETSFTYEEYYAEYSEEIVESYETSETVIEETMLSEEFTAEMSEEDISEEQFSEEDLAMIEADDEDLGDEEVSEDDAEEEFTDEDESADEMAEDEGAEEVEEVEEEGYDEEESYDEPEEESYDEGGDEG